VAIDHFSESEKYRPARIKILLVCEAPPPSGRHYFYVPRDLRNKRPVRDDSALPATIFSHYFSKRPDNKKEYICFLKELQEKGIFLIDICDDPVKVRGCPEGVEQIKKEILSLRDKMARRRINVPDKGIVFLLPRTHYLKQLKQEFPKSRFVPWIDFRMSHEC
jgi:hypothetical protein